MASQFYNVTTNNGDAKIANAIATATKLNITHVVFGDGNGSVPTPDKSRTALVNQVYSVAPSNYYLHPTIANRLIVEAIIPSDVGGFYIREVGLIADTTVLISNGSVAPIFKEASTDGTREYKLKFAINIVDSSIANITLDSSLIYVTQDAIVNNLTTDDATKAVSAKQAKNLKESITAIEDIVLYAPIAWPSTIIPVGYLALMGQTISQAMYPKLFALYGSTLPDMRAYSIKGLDYGRGIDSGRTVLTAQNDAIQNFTADFGIRPYVPNAGSGNAAVYPGNGFTVSAVSGGSNAKLIGDGTAQAEYTKVTLTVASLVRTSTETRVKNIAFLYIVKAG